MQKLSEEELKIQKLKENLIINLDFNPYQCFRILDIENKNSIDCYDLYNYLKNNKQYSTLHECYLIIIYYDKEDQNFWSYENFVSFILNGYKNNLNSVHYEFHSPDKQNLTSEISELLLNIFIAELTLIRNTLPLVEKIKQRYDYNIVDLFKSLTDTSNITKKTLSNFFKRNGYDEYEDEKLEAIIDRLSLSKNKLIPAYDIKKIFEVGYCDTTKDDLYEAMLNCPNRDLNKGYYINNNKNDENKCNDGECSVTSEKCFNTDYCLKSNNKNENDNFFNNNSHFYTDTNFYNSYNNPLKNSDNNCKCCKKETISMKNSENNFYKNQEMQKQFLNTTDLLNSQLSNSNMDTNNQSKLNLSKNDMNNSTIKKDINHIISLTKQKYNVLTEMEKQCNNCCCDNSFSFSKDKPLQEEQYFIEFLRYVLGNELLIEKTKCELALRADFNIEDCLNIFISNDKKNNNKIVTPEDFIYGTQNLNLKFTGDEMKLIFCKYDLMNLGYLTFNDFFDMIVPFDVTYREMVTKRTKMTFSPKYKKGEIFLGATKNYLQNLLQCICISETNIEKERHKLFGYLNELSLDKIFWKMDKDKKGYIIEKDLEEYLKDSDVDIYGTNAHQLLFIRFDRKKLGILTIQDIINEVSFVFPEN